MNEPSEPFDRIVAAIDSGHVDNALRDLAAHFREGKKYPELFEALKAGIRHELGLSLLYSDEPDDLDSEEQLNLENRLLQACREVGTLLVRDGDIARGWMYLQPLPDRALVRSLIENVAVSDENVDELIDVALGQWAAPAYGYRILLERRGTCNAITFYDTQVGTENKSVCQQLACILIDHVYNELRDNVERCVRETANQSPPAKNQKLGQLIKNRDWLFADCGHHLDVTHLASTMRIARVCDDPIVVKKALELAEYGCRLDSALTLQGDPPFEELFDDHRLYFQALLGIEVDQSICHFRAKAESLDQESAGILPYEVLIDLMCRSGRKSDAIRQALEVDDLFDRNALSSLLIQVAESNGEFQQISDYFKQNQDLLSYSLARIRRSQLPS